MRTKYVKQPLLRKLDVNEILNLFVGEAVPYSYMLM